MSADLLEPQVEIATTANVFINFQNLIDSLKVVLSEDWQTLDDISKGPDSSTKKKLNTEVGKSKSAAWCITKHDVNISWVMCTTRRSWCHLFLTHLRGILWPSYKRIETENSNLRLKYVPKN